jgi:hypothetical protein
MVMHKSLLSLNICPDGTTSFCPKYCGKTDYSKPKDNGSRNLYHIPPLDPFFKDPPSFIHLKF